MRKSINKLFTSKTTDQNRYDVDTFNPQKNVFNNYVAMLSERILENSFVLDLGCNQGRFGSTLKSKGCKVVGVDINEDAVNKAIESSNYEKVLIGDFTQKSTYESLCNNQKYDYIIMADVLEHVVDPTEVLVMYQSALKEKGKILVSIPNFANIKVVLDLLNNQIAYTDIGILDNTHIKWFTKRSFIQWIDQINSEYNDIKYDCEYIGATILNDDFDIEILEDYPKLYEILSQNKNFKSSQLLFELTKLSSDDNLEKLPLLEQEEETDIVDIIGKALEGKDIGCTEVELGKNERFQYENITRKLEKDWKSAMAANEVVEQEWKKCIQANADLELKVKEAKDGWQECNKHWHEAVDVIAYKENEIKNLKEKYDNDLKIYKEKIDRLFSRQEELEIEITKIMERDIILQQENNALREKGARDDNR